MAEYRKGLAKPSGVPPASVTATVVALISISPCVVGTLTRTLKARVVY